MVSTVAAKKCSREINAHACSALAVSGSQASVNSQWDLRTPSEKQTKKTKILHVGEGKHQLKIGKVMEVGIRRYYLWYQVAQIQGIFRKLIILTSAPGKRNEWNNNFWGDTFQLPSFLTSHGFLFSPSGNFGGRSCTQVGEVNPRDPITETENGNGS